MPVRSTKPLTLPEEPQLGMKRSHPSPQEPEEVRVCDCLCDLVFLRQKMWDELSKSGIAQ